MKNTIKLLTLALVVALTSSAYALNNSKGYGPAGCGLGAYLLGDQKGAMQIIAATVNGTSGNQTFGISSGTLNCGASAFSASRDVDLFIETNHDLIAEEASFGEGETLSSLGELMGCQETAKFNSFMKKNWSKIFNGKNISSNIKAAATNSGLSCQI